MNTFKKSISKQLTKLRGNPKWIAKSFALGSFMGVTPFIGMQIMISVLLSWVFHLSKAAAIVGVVNTNWTKGLVLYPLNYAIGVWILGISNPIDIHEGLHGISLMGLQHIGISVFFPLLIGGIITGSLLATMYYYLVLRILRGRETATNKSMQTLPVPENRYALVTGASQGLGKAMAYELASRKINLLLVALENEGLPALCQELESRYDIKAHYYEADFFERESVYEVAHWVTSNYPVFMLINNAGLGGTMAFDQASPEYMDKIIQVNVRATSLLTRLLLPELRKQPKSYILNVASMASFSPFAFKTVYPASKAFVYSFSRGLHEELRGSSIKVSVIHPGPLKTNLDVTKRIEKLGMLGRIGLLSTERTAYIAIKQLLKSDSLILPGILNKLNWVLMMIIPNAWKLPVVSRVVRQEIAAQPKPETQWAI